MKRILLLTITISLLFLTACVATLPVDETAFVSPQPTMSATAVDPVTTTPVATPETEPTATPKPSLRATVDAMAAAVNAKQELSESAETPNVVARDDYVGMLEQGWRIVRDNYVRDDFNGVDWDAIHDEYLIRAESITNSEDFWDMMEAFIREIGDNHSRFVRPDRFGTEFNIELSEPPPTDELWTGMTIWPAREDDRLLVWDVCDRSSAASAGLQRGDVILAINGAPVERSEEGFAREDFIDALVGNGRVTLTVLTGPESTPKDVTLRYGGASGCGDWAYGLLIEEPRVGYLRIPDFSADSEVTVLDLIEAMEEDGDLDGLIVDVRHNPGGNSDRTIAVFTTGVFGKEGPLRSDSVQSVYRIRGPVRWNESTPMVVLTDGASHSAAEYFATAMQQSGRAVLVGQATAGNTEGINAFGLPDGSLIRLAWTTLELPDGSSLEGVGVIPDIQVPLGEWGLREDPDVQLQAAIDTILELIGQSS